MSTPSSTTRPRSGDTMPAITRNSVLLPLPDGPSSATISPAATCRPIASSTTRSPKRTVTSSTASTLTGPRGQVDDQHDQDRRHCQDRRECEGLRLEDPAGPAEEALDRQRQGLLARAAEKARGTELPERDRRRQTGAHQQRLTDERQGRRRPSAHRRGT